MASGEVSKAKSGGKAQNKKDKKKRHYIALSDSAESQRLAREQPTVPDRPERRMAEAIFWVLAYGGAGLYIGITGSGGWVLLACVIFFLAFFSRLDDLKPRYKDLKRRPEAAAFTAAVNEGNIIEVNQDIVDAVTELADAAGGDVDVQRLLQDRWQTVGELHRVVLPALRPTSGALPATREIAQDRFREGVQAIFDGGSPVELEAANYHMLLELGVADPHEVIYQKPQKELPDQ